MHQFAQHIVLVTESNPVTGAGIISNVIHVSNGLEVNPAHERELAEFFFKEAISTFKIDNAEHIISIESKKTAPKIDGKSFCNSMEICSFKIRSENILIPHSFTVFQLNTRIVEV